MIANAENSPALFPTLTEEQLKRFCAYGTEETVAKGQTLIQEWSKVFDCFVVVSGEIHILDPADNDSLIAVHHPGGFTGDTDMLSDRAAVIRAVAVEDSVVVRIPGAVIREVIANDTALSDIIVNAFLARRSLLLASEGHGIKLIGSRFSQDTVRIREWLTKKSGVTLGWK
jgi:thioredoxin reductase (NADPH)